ncbi:MAG TPA: DUF4340 domain-containing protein [Opitutaceae bacterium]|jgi:hypothetical protein
MKLKTLVITVAALAALSVAAYLSNQPAPPPPSDARVGQPLLDDATAEKASALTVSDQGKSVEVDKAGDGSWTVKSYFGLPADFEKISRLVQDLHEAKVERFVTDNPARLSHLDFKDSRVTLGDAEGKTLWSVTLGKTPDNGNGKFIRFGDETKAYLTAASVWLDTDAKGWANAQLVSVKPDDVEKVEIPLDSGSVTLSRPKKDAAWTADKTPAGMRLIADKPASIVSSLTSLRFSDTTAPGDPAAAEAAKHEKTYKVTTFGGQTLTVVFGRKPEEKKLKLSTAKDAKEDLSALTKIDTKAPAKPIEPEFDTIPAGPVFVSVVSSDPKAGVNSLMKARAFETDDYVYTGLPAKESDLFEPAPKAK